jgi:hypothetical protein
MPKRSLARRKNALSKLQARIADLDGRPACRRLIHLWLPGQPRPVATPGCEDCIALQREYDSAHPPMPASTPKPEQATDMVEDKL